LIADLIVILASVTAVSLIPVLVVTIGAFIWFFIFVILNYGA